MPVFVKVCGITSEEDALLAVAMGADALGFVFAPGSPRQLRPVAARDIVSRLPRGEVLTFGVFRDEFPEQSHGSDAERKCARDRPEAGDHDEHDGEHEFRHTANR